MRPKLEYINLFVSDGRLYISGRVHTDINPMWMTNFERSLPPIMHLLDLMRPTCRKGYVIFSENTQTKNKKKIKFLTDRFGTFNLALTASNIEMQSLKLYLSVKGIHFFQSTPPLVDLKPDTKLIFVDFDKTLIETKYSTLKEIYQSLTTPLGHFAPIESSLNLLRQYQTDNYLPIILSASPHFYYLPIIEWLKERSIQPFTLILKDYRLIFSFRGGRLATKDLTIQGAYKLLNLLHWTDRLSRPNDIILMGDDHESDPLIYLTYKKILTSRDEPIAIWNKIKTLKQFNLTNLQSDELLQYIFSLKRKIKREKLKVLVRIFIKGSLERVHKNYPLTKHESEQINFY